MIVDGKAIAESVKEDLKKKISKSGERASLGVLVSTSDFATEKFLDIKKRFAKDIGVELETVNIQGFKTEAIVGKVKEMAQEYEGIIVQFPLEKGIDANIVRNAIPISHDVDVISDNAIELFKNGNIEVLPPVVGAIAEIVERHNITIKDKNVVVVGKGRLVGAPASIWFAQQRGSVKTVTNESSSILEDLKEGDILVLGTGVPGLVKPDMVKNDVVMFDAGTSEEGGKLAGDADPACAEKASLFTPVPGGIGPITVAMIFRNLLVLQGGVK